MRAIHINNIRVDKKEFIRQMNEFYQQNKHRYDYIDDNDDKCITVFDDFINSLQLFSNPIFSLEDNSELSERLLVYINELKID